MPSEQTPAEETFDFTQDAPPPASGERSSSYSLLLLFYITTVAAILAAVCRLAFVGTNWSMKTIVFGYVAAGGASVLMTMVLGYLIGRTHISAALGLLAGLICGMVALLMTLVQPSHYESAGMILCGGCWILSVIAIIGNRWQHP